MLSGILIIDKPIEWTSHDVVAKLRGTLKQKRIGHGGTLDPMATGVLPIFIGRATRAVEYCTSADKEYIAGIKLSITTDTQDITGNILSESEVTATAEDIKAILPSFMGKQKQVPPMYSAIKKDGKKLYELARQGKEIPREPREIEIKEIEILKDQHFTRQPVGATVPGRPDNLGPFIPDYTLRVACSKGTYIRTLCHDIGAALGCGAALSSLRRTRAGIFIIEDALTLEAVLAMRLTDSVSDVILPTDAIFSNFPSIYLSEPEVKKVKNGVQCHTQKNTENGTYKVYSPDGEFLLLAEVNNSKIITKKTFFTPS